MSKACNLTRYINDLVDEVALKPFPIIFNVNESLLVKFENGYE